MLRGFRHAGRLLIGSLLAVGGVGLLLNAASHSTADHRRPGAFSTAQVPIAQLQPSAPRATVVDPVLRKISQPFPASRLQIEALHVDAPVSQIFSTQQELIPPADPHQVGWWAGSMLPGSTRGTVVLTGHVDTAVDGLGALYSLDKVHPGMSVQLSGAAGIASYRIDSLTYYAKNGGLPHTLFADTGPARLVLISCGGSFDSATRSYRDNVVVTAALVS